MRSTRNFPATTSCPKVVSWNWNQMFRSDVAEVWYVRKSPVVAPMPSEAYLTTLSYAAALLAAASTVCR